MSNSIRKFKRGEALFRESDKPDKLYLIQTGRVSLFSNRGGGQRLEIAQLHNGHVVGENALLGSGGYIFSAEAINETTAVEIPLATVRSQLEVMPDAFRVMLKSLNERLKSSCQEIRGFKLEREQVPCAPPFIPKMFSILQMVARHTGTKEGSDIILPWSTLHIATVRLFLESATRMQGVVEILTKLGFAKMSMQKNEEGNMEIDKVILHSVQLVEDFAEFYQYNLYKGMRSEIIFVDPICHMAAAALVKVTSTLPLDRLGAVQAPFNQLVNDVKEQTGFILKPTHLEFLEKKGLFIKRSNRPDGVYLAFDFKEFEKTVTFWDIIDEIDHWNQTGKVDLNEKPARFKKIEQAAGVCPECKKKISEEMKFCPHCGQKLVAA